MFASFLKLTLAELIYNVFITVFGFSVSCACVVSSGFVSSGFVSSGCSGFASSFCIFSFLIHPFASDVSTHAHPFTISTTFISSSFFTSIMSLALITGTIFILVSSPIFCFPSSISY